MEKLSVVIITKNEENHIEDCLKSVQWADEIIVVDSGSSDKTVELARRYTEKVYYQQWLGYAAQKNFAIEKATGDWIISLDADEAVSSDLVKEIRGILNRGAEFEGYFIPRKNFLNSRWMRYAGQYPDYQLRFFRSNARYLTREVHERVEIKGPAGYLTGPIIHKTYHDINAFVQKINLYTGLEARLRVKQGHRPGVFSFVWQPLRKFLWAYFYKKGFRDGILGLIISISLAYYVFLELAKTWEAFEFGKS